MAETEENIQISLNELNYKLNKALQDQEETENRQTEIDEQLQYKIETIRHQAETIKLQEKVINDQSEELATMRVSSDCNLYEELRREKEDKAKLLKENQEQAAEIQFLQRELQKVKEENLTLTQLIAGYKERITELEAKLEAFETFFYNRTKAALIEAIKKPVRKDCIESLAVLLKSVESNTTGKNSIYQYFLELLKDDNKSHKELALSFMKRFPRLRPFTTEQKLALKAIENRISSDKYKSIFKSLNSLEENSTDEILQTHFFEPETSIGSKPSKFASTFLEKHVNYYTPLSSRATAILAIVKQKVELHDFNTIESAVNDTVKGNITRELFFDLVGSDNNDCDAAYNFVKRSTFAFKSSCVII